MDAFLSLDSRNLEREWANCERELHATGMPDVERYQADLRALRTETDRLQNHGTIDALVQDWASLAPGDMDHRAKLARGAAFALRASQIKAANDARAVSERIARAREAGETWAIIQEMPEADRENAAGFTSTTMHVPSGLAMVVTAQVVPMTDRLTYSLAIVRLESVTGALIDSAPGLEDWLETADRSALDEAIEKWRGKIEEGLS